MIYEKKNGKRYEYYTVDEAISKGIAFVYWREMTEDGWVKSDDNLVIQGTVKNIYEKCSRQIRCRRVISTGISRAYPHGKMPMLLQKNMDMHSYGNAPRMWYEPYLKNTRFMRAMAVLVLTGKLRMTSNRKYDKNDYEQFIKLGYALSKRDKFGWYRVRTIFNHERVRMAIQEEIEKILQEENINVASTVGLIIEARDMARAKKDPKAMIAVAVKLSELVGIDDYLRNKRKPVQGTLGDGGPQHEALPGSENTFQNVLSAVTPEPIQDAEVVS